MSDIKNIIWTNEAKNQLKTIFNFIKKNQFKEQIR